MGKLKRLISRVENIVEVECPISIEELSDRQKDYPLLEPRKFARIYGDLLYTPINFFYKGKIHMLQVNFCKNPFCKWFGLSQERFNSVSNKPYRYRLSGSPRDESQSYKCNEDKTGKS